MNVTKYAIRHRLSVYFLILILCLGGVGVYVSMPRESFPEVEIPFILVYTIYPGVSPTDMETLVTRPIETELKAVSGIKEISSTTSEGLSSIAVEFNPETDIETALASVREKVDLAKSDLPPEAEDPRVQDMDFSQVPIMMITLSGPVGSQRLTEVAEEIQEDLEALPGVNRVNVIGGRVREVHVHVDPKRLAFFELSLTDVVVAVARENRNVPGGEIAVGGLEYLVRLPAEVRLPSEIEDFVIKVRDGDPVFVRDVAEVVFGFEDETSRSRVDREPSVTLSVEKRTGANLVGVADLVNAELGRWDEMLPEGINTAVVGDISVEIRRMVNELENNVISGLLLVIGCLMAFVGFRNAFFVGVAIPLSMMASFLVLGWIGYTLNMMVLFSLILMLGMLVDNAVVIVENIYRHRENGDAGPDAAYEATVEVARPVIASTITTLCAFSPLLIWPGIIGDFMSYLPVTLIIGLSASLVVALIINPTLCAHLMKPPRHGVIEGQHGRTRVPACLPPPARVVAPPGSGFGDQVLVPSELGAPRGFRAVPGNRYGARAGRHVFPDQRSAPGGGGVRRSWRARVRGAGGLLVRLEPDPPSLPLVAVPHRSPLRMDLDDVRRPGRNGWRLHPDREGRGALPGGRAPADLHRCRDDRRLQSRRVRRGGSAHRGTDHRHRGHEAPGGERGLHGSQHESGRQRRESEPESGHALPA